jgi:hypothetical protein
VLLKLRLVASLSTLSLLEKVKSILPLDLLVETFYQLVMHLLSENTIKQDQIAAISVIGASRESRNFGDIDTDRDNVFVFQAEYRYFTNNTFYIKPSVYYRRVDEYLGENFLTGDEIRDDYRDIGVDLQLEINGS